MIWDKFHTLQADTAGLSEVNLDWRLIPAEDSLWARGRLYSHGPVKAAQAHNHHPKPRNKSQVGGCITMAFERMLPRCISTTKDPSGLGRWISQLFEGKGNHKARLVSGYFPCKSTAGEHTVYTQHKDHFRSRAADEDDSASDREPHQAWLEDFQEEIEKWLEDDEKIVIRLDANSDVRTGPVAAMLRELGFEEQVTFRHGGNRDPPGTHMANTKGVPIDGVWTNFAHGQMRCGYLDFAEGLPGDHHTVWIDLPADELFGYTPPDLHKVFPPDLVASDP